MNPREPRKIWLVTKGGVPQGCAWAMVKTQAEADPGRESWGAALGPNEPLSDGWDATPTEWRRVPQVVRPDVLALAPAQIVGRDVVSAGLRYDLDGAGRVHADHKEGDEREPYEPDALVSDEQALLSAAESLGRDIQFVEAGTLKRWRTKGDASASNGSEDVLIHREGGQLKRDERA